MKTVAAVLVKTGQPLELVELDIPVLKDGQVLVEMTMSGVCHTQLLEARGHRGEDKFLPHCLGHEGTGTVREVGRAVSKVKAGESVILSWMKGSGADVPGTVYGWNGKNVNSGAITTFSKFTVVSENRLVKALPGLSIPQAALMGCALPTGLGVIFNTARATAGQSVVVYGVGGIGLSAIAGAHAVGCSPIIAVDKNPERLEAARKMGATHVVNAGPESPAAIRALSPGGADIAIEATGQPAVMKEALSLVKPRGGTAVVVGNARHGSVLELNPAEFNQGKRLLGTWGGDNDPDRDFPRYEDLLLNKRIDVSPLVAAVYEFSRVNAALDDLEAGRVVRPLIDFSRA